MRTYIYLHLSPARSLKVIRADAAVLVSGTVDDSVLRKLAMVRNRRMGK